MKDCIAIHAQDAGWTSRRPADGLRWRPPTDCARRLATDSDSHSAARREWPPARRRARRRAAAAPRGAASGLRMEHRGGRLARAVSVGHRLRWPSAIGYAAADRHRGERARRQCGQGASDTAASADIHAARCA